MDIGVVFSYCAHLYTMLFNASFTMFGVSFTIGQWVTYGMILGLGVLFIRHFLES